MNQLWFLRGFSDTNQETKPSGKKPPKKPNRNFGRYLQVYLDVSESVVHKSAIAAVVTELVATVDKVLLGEREELSSLAVVLTLQGSGGRESPARTALTLVLHGGYSTYAEHKKWRFK